MYVVFVGLSVVIVGMCFGYYVYLFISLVISVVRIVDFEGRMFERLRFVIG